MEGVAISIRRSLETGTEGVVEGAELCSMGADHDHETEERPIKGASEDRTQGPP
jgi:hypothetical protein